jgi:hypothetical protein
MSAERLLFGTIGTGSALIGAALIYNALTKHSDVLHDHVAGFDLGQGLVGLALAAYCFWRIRNPRRPRQQ